MSAKGLRATAGGAVIEVRVMPRAPRNRIDGWRDGRLVVRVTAPPVDSAANDALVVVLADALDVPKSAVRIASGATSRSKSVEISGMTRDQILARLQRPS